MLFLIKSEINYSKILILILFPLIPILVFLQTAIEDMGNMALLAVLFILLQNWNSFRNKERREYRNFLLPLTARQIAISRLSIIFIFSILKFTISFFISIISINNYRYHRFRLFCLFYIERSPARVFQKNWFDSTPHAYAYRVYWYCV